MTKADSAESDEKEKIDLKTCFSVFVFDWDDTLFPTSALIAMGPKKMKTVLEAIDTLVYRLLTSCLAVPNSHVMVLSSANIDWIYHSSREFLPQVSPLFTQAPSNLSIVSAHRKSMRCSGADDHVDPASVMAWKVETACSRVPLLCSLMADMNVRAVQVIGLGDGPQDLEATRELAGALQASLSDFPSFLKTVAMKPKPLDVELSGELRKLVASLDKLVRAPRSFHQSMHRSAPPQLHQDQHQKGQQLQMQQQMQVALQVAAAAAATKVFNLQQSSQNVRLQSSAFNHQP
jgi:hypothetical protein